MPSSVFSFLEICTPNHCRVAQVGSCMNLCTQVKLPPVEVQTEEENREYLLAAERRRMRLADILISGLIIWELLCA